ncbi:hypothetical protein [Moraxella lacunata]|uniref:hypothetical protein n=1 Tax=Moraxella lacunata TaxID=477 RepID=UPI003EE35BF9
MPSIDPWFCCQWLFLHLSSFCRVIPSLCHKELQMRQKNWSFLPNKRFWFNVWLETCWI